MPTGRRRSSVPAARRTRDADSDGRTADAEYNRRTRNLRPGKRSQYDKRNTQKTRGVFRRMARLDAGQVVDARRDSRRTTVRRISPTDAIGAAADSIRRRHVPTPPSVSSARLERFRRVTNSARAPMKAIAPMKARAGATPRASARARAVASQNARFNRSGAITTQPVRNPPTRVSKPPRVQAPQARRTVSTRPGTRTRSRLR